MCRVTKPLRAKFMAHLESKLCGSPCTLKVHLGRCLRQRAFNGGTFPRPYECCFIRQLTFVCIHAALLIPVCPWPSQCVCVFNEHLASSGLLRLGKKRCTTVIHAQDEEEGSFRQAFSQHSVLYKAKKSIEMYESKEYLATDNNSIT